MIFWKHIKGFNKSVDDALWSFIRFQKQENSTLADFANAPSINLNTSDSDTSDPTLGHIITEKAVGQSVDNDFTFKNMVNFGATNPFKLHKGTYDNTAASLLEFNNQEYFCFKQGNHYPLTIDGAGTVHSQSILAIGYIDATTYMHTGTYIQAGTYLKAASYCEAQYFNATSDRRAKTDIQPLLINALELVRKTQLYSFKYKETDTPSIGIIAQDVQNININGFKLVDNEEATGKDLDYMTIHESKLTYILWKAVQEQQKIIEGLQQEIKQIKKELD